MGDTKVANYGYASVSETDKVSAFYAAAVGSCRVYPKIKLIGKLGLAVGNNSETCNIGGSTCLSASTTKVTPVIGFGGSYAVNKRVAVRVEFDHYFSIGTFNTNGGEYTAGGFSLFNVNALYRF